ncbi:peptidoglycan-binding domain-containing protein [Brachybacterium paraconglomeratum]|uniref:peptidoglycan-binding domain-containing protein n=1 Tax=Brachybacterium paraconglomeratum TaxID=173362 RepID=UPI003F7C260C
MAYYSRKHWTSTANAAVSVKRKQVHATLHYPGFGSSSIRTAGWSRERCFQQLRAWRNMHVGSGAYKEVAYNLYALPTGDVAEGRGNRQNGANGNSTANRAGMSVQVLIGDDEPLTEGHLKAIFEAFALLERWHPGITSRQYGHSHWVSTSCPGPHVRAGIPYRAGAVPKDGGGKGITGNVPGLSDGLADVDDAQRWLTALGYDPGPVDGSFGAKTQAATKQFQTDFNITLADGRPGPATRALLEDAVTTLNALDKKLDRLLAFGEQIHWRADAKIPALIEGVSTKADRLLAFGEQIHWRVDAELPAQINGAQAAIIKAIQESGKAQGLTDAQVEKIATAAAEASARVSAEDVAAQLEITPREG